MHCIVRLTLFFKFSSLYLDCPMLCAGLGDTAISDACCSEQFCQCYHGEESFTLACFVGRVFCNSQGRCVEESECQLAEQHCCEDTLGNEPTSTTQTRWFQFLI